MTESLSHAEERALHTWLRLSPIIACCCLMSVGYSYVIPAFALVMEHRGIAAWLIGASSGSQNLVIIVAGVFFPRLFRALGIRRAMFAGLLGSLAAALVIMAVEPPYAWFPLRMLMGFGFYVSFIGGEVWLSQEAGPRLRGRIIGVYGSACATGLFVGPLLVQWTGTQGLTPFLVAAGIIAGAMVPLFFLRGQSPNMDEPSAGGFRKFLWLMPVVMSGIFLYGVLDQSLLSLLPIYGLHVGLSESRALLLLTVWIAGAIALQVPIGWLGDRIGRRRVIIGSGAAALAACVAIPFLIEGGVLLWIVLVICGGGVMGLWTVTLAVLGDRFRGAELGAATTMLGICYAIGSSVGPPIAGAGMNAWGPHGLMAVLGTAAAAFLVFSVAYSRRHGWRERKT